MMQLRHSSRRDVADAAAAADGDGDGDDTGRTAPGVSLLTQRQIG